MFYPSTSKMNYFSIYIHIYLLNIHSYLTRFSCQFKTYFSIVCIYLHDSVMTHDIYLNIIHNCLSRCDPPPPPPLSHVKTHILLNSINNYLTSGGSPFKDTYTSIVYIATPSTPTFIHGYDIHIAFLKVGCLLGISYQEITVNGMKQLCTKFRMNLRDYDSNKVR